MLLCLAAQDITAHVFSLTYPLEQPGEAEGGHAANSERLKGPDVDSTVGGLRNSQAEEREQDDHGRAKRAGLE